MVVVIADEFRDHVVQMSLAKEDELIEAFPANCTDEPLASAVEVGRSFGQRIGLHARIFDRLRELLGVFHVPVVNYHLGLLLSVLRLLNKPVCLLADPSRVGMLGRFGDEYFPCLQTQEHQHVEVADSLGGDRLHREEIASPERFTVAIEEVGPRVRRAIRAGFDVMLFEDASNSLAADLDPEFAHLAHDPGQPEASFFGNRENQLPDFFWLPLTAFGIFRFWFAVLLLSNPTVEGGWADNRDEFLDGFANGLPVLEKRVAFFRGRMNLLGQSRPKNLVLVLQVFDVLGEFVVGGRGDQGEEWVENLGHWCIVVCCDSGCRYTFIRPH